MAPGPVALPAAAGALTEGPVALDTSLVGTNANAAISRMPTGYPVELPASGRFPRNLPSRFPAEKPGDCCGILRRPCLGL
jgi:hypothetical protein